jgi:hypothetical protein
MASLVIAAISWAGEKCDFRPAADVMMDHLPLQLKGTEEFLKITFGVKKSGSESPSEAHILIFCEKIAPAIGESSQIAGQLSEKDASAAIQNHIEKIAVPVTAQLACVPVTSATYCCWIKKSMSRRSFWSTAEHFAGADAPNRRVTTL